MGIQNSSFDIQKIKRPFDKLRETIITLWDEGKDFFVIILFLVVFALGLYCGGKVMENTQKLSSELKVMSLSTEQAGSELGGE